MCNVVCCGLCVWAGWLLLCLVGATLNTFLSCPQPVFVASLIFIPCLVNSILWKIPTEPHRSFPRCSFRLEHHRCCLHRWPHRSIHREALPCLPWVSHAPVRCMPWELVLVCCVCWEWVNGGDRGWIQEMREEVQKSFGARFQKSDMLYEGVRCNLMNKVLWRLRRVSVEERVPDIYIFLI